MNVFTSQALLMLDDQLRIGPNCLVECYTTNKNDKQNGLWIILYGALCQFAKMYSVNG